MVFLILLVLMVTLVTEMGIHGVLFKGAESQFMICPFNNVTEDLLVGSAPPFRSSLTVF